MLPWVDAHPGSCPRPCPGQTWDPDEQWQEGRLGGIRATPPHTLWTGSGSPASHPLAHSDSTRAALTIGLTLVLAVPQLAHCVHRTLRDLALQPAARQAAAPLRAVGAEPFFPRLRAESHKVTALRCVCVHVRVCLCGATAQCGRSEDNFLQDSVLSFPCVGLRDCPDDQGSDQGKAAHGLPPPPPSAPSLHRLPPLPQSTASAFQLLQLHIICLMHFLMCFVLLLFNMK